MEAVLYTQIRSVQRCYSTYFGDSEGGLFGGGAPSAGAFRSCDHIDNTKKSIRYEIRCGACSRFGQYAKWLAALRAFLIERERIANLLNLPYK